MLLRRRRRRPPRSSKCITLRTSSLWNLTNVIQAVADAYYVLSDPTRRREYDALHTSRKADRTDDPGSSNTFFNQFAGMFGARGGAGAAPAEAERPDADGVFADAFEEVTPTAHFHAFGD